MTDIKKHLGSNIRRFRLKRGFSQEKLAETVNMAANYLGLIENGKKFPSAEMIERIAAALDTDALALFSRAEAPPGELDISRFHEQMLHDVAKAISHHTKCLEEQYNTTPKNRHP